MCAIKGATSFFLPGKFTLFCCNTCSQNYFNLNQNTAVGAVDMFLKSLVNSTVATRRALHKGALTMISSLFACKRHDFDKCERHRRQSDWRGLLCLPSESTTTSSPTTIFDDKLSHDKLSEGNTAAAMGVPTKSLTLKSAQQLSI